MWGGVCPGFFLGGCLQTPFVCAGDVAVRFFVGALPGFFLGGLPPTPPLFSGKTSCFARKRNRHPWRIKALQKDKSAQATKARFPAYHAHSPVSRVLVPATECYLWPVSRVLVAGIQI